MRTNKLAAIVALALMLVVPATGFAASPPVLMVGGYSTAPADISAGGHFRLSITVENGTEGKATNVLVRLGAAAPTPATAADGAAVAGSSQNPFAVLSRSDARYVGTVKGRSTSTVDFDLIADPRIGPGAYVIPVTIDYDAPGGHRTEIQHVGVVVTRPTTFDVNGLDGLGTLKSGASKSVKVEVVNSSPYPVKGVSFELKGSGVKVAQGRMFVGRLDQSDGEVLESRVTAASAGQQRLTLTITYIDDFNRTQTMTKESIVTITASADDGSAAASKPVAPPQSFWASIAGFFGFGG